MIELVVRDISTVKLLAIEDEISFNRLGTVVSVKATFFDDLTLAS